MSAQETQMYIIRPLNLDNVDECAELWRGIQAASVLPLGGEWGPLKIIDEIKNHHAEGVFLTSASGSVGPLCGFNLYRNLADKQGFEIMLIAIGLQFQRQGLGRLLLKSIIKQLAGGQVVWLEVHAGNVSAVRLYESLGFLRVGARKRYYQDGGAAILYEYRKNGDG